MFVKGFNHENGLTLRGGGVKHMLFFKWKTFEKNGRMWVYSSPGVLFHSSPWVWLLCELIRSEGITVIGGLVNH